MRRWLLRPSFWVALASILAYWDHDALHGEFVYDDDGSIRQHPVVNGKAPWTDVLVRDFWGTPMKDIQSHKSFRPITTLSFKLNWVLFPYDGTGLPGEDRVSGTYSFRVVNVMLHGIVSGLVTEAAALVFGSDLPQDVIAQMVTGFVFGLHPVHVEAVSNVTSRGELLMSLFFLLAFLSYASQVVSGSTRRQMHNNNSRTFCYTSFFLIYVIPWICMTLSLFSKEQGASTLISLVLFDLIHNHESIRQVWQSMSKGDPKAWAFGRRTVVLAVETLLVCAWRYWLNGETKPDFIFDQNPAGFATDRFTRAFSISWVYCLYIRDALYPQHLSVDWSGRSIALITDWNTVRVVPVLALWFVLLCCAGSLLVGPSSRWTLGARYYRKVVLGAFFAFLFSPFLLSSNILVVVGLMKADRVIYLPLMGFCILEASLIRFMCSPMDPKRKSSLSAWHESPMAKLGHAFLMIQTLFFCRKLHERNLAWSDSLTLWTAAYHTNPQSFHTIYNCGYQLSLVGRYEEAEQVLRPIGDPRVDSATTTFVYAMVLQNLERCDEARPLIDQALEVVEERKLKGGARNSEDSTRRTESNLLVASAFCTMDLAERAGLMIKAVNADMTNSYAIDSASNLDQFIEQQREIGDPQGLLKGFEKRRSKS